jgi:hypothetical protein
VLVVGALIPMAPPAFGPTLPGFVAPGFAPIDGGVAPVAAPGLAPIPEGLITVVVISPIDSRNAAYGCRRSNSLISYSI